MSLNKAIATISKLLDHCPECKSDNIANEGPAGDAGLEVTCHDCGHQWIDDDRIKKDAIIKLLVASRLKREANTIKNMSKCEYTEFIRNNFDIASLSR